MKNSCTGIILSGGNNSRFGYINKAFKKIGKLKILENTYKTLSKIFDKIIIVSNDPSIYLKFNCLIVSDHYPIRCSLNGIHAGLFYSSTKYSFFTACDMPFIKQNLIKFILNEIETNKDIIVPETKFGFEPLFAVYSKKCIKIIEKQIEERKLKILELFSKVNVKRIDPKYINRIDPNLFSFFNVNNYKDLVKAKNYLKIFPNIL